MTLSIDHFPGSTQLNPAEIAEELPTAEIMYDRPVAIGAMAAKAIKSTELELSDNPSIVLGDS